LEFHLEEAVGQAHQHVHGDGEAEDYAEGEQDEGICYFLDLPAEAAELDLSFRVEVAILEKHVKPDAVDAVHWGFLIAEQCLDGEGDGGDDGAVDDEAGGEDDGGESFFQFGQEGVEIEDDYGEEEEGVDVEAARDDGPQEETAEGGGDAAGDDCRGDVGEEVDQPATDQREVEQTREEGDLADLLLAVYQPFVRLVVCTHNYKLLSRGSNESLKVDEKT
jgi:hypothetical protein